MADEPIIQEYGTCVEFGSDILGAVGLAYTEIDQVISATPPMVAIGVRERKWLKAPNQAIDKKASWRNTEDVAVVAFYDKARFAALTALEGITRAWRITLPDGDNDTAVNGSTITFEGFISKIGQPQINGDGDWQIDFTITVSGRPTFVAAA